MDVEQFISSIFVKNPLWDQKDPQHHNRYVLDKLWDAVAGEMKLTRGMVRSKWKTLRDTIPKELKKVTVVKRSGDAYVTPIKSSWQYFESLNFLKDQFTVRSSGGNLPDEGCSSHVLDDEDTQHSNVIENINTQEDDACVQNYELHSAEERNTQSHTRTCTPSSTSRSGQEKKRKRQNEQDELGNTLIKLEESKLRLLENQTQKTTDEDMSFFESLLPHIRTLTPQRKLLLRMKIQQTVYNFVYEKQATATQYSASISQQIGSQQPQYNLTEIDHRMTAHHEYSNPPSVASYLSGFSEDTY